MTLFASDLDRTLIFSPRFLGETPVEECVLMESLGERPIAYMTKVAFERLQEVIKSYQFIPVTTRNREEFRRLPAFQSVEYAIVNNGGTILINGVEHEEWTRHIETKITELSLTHQEIKEEFDRYYPDAFKVTRLSDELIWVFVQEIEKELPDFASVQQSFLDKGWKVEKTGRKVYIIPHFLSKWAAVAYVQKLLGIPSVIAAGDSRMDYDLVYGARKSFIPKHGEIAEHNLVHAITTMESGIKAGEEIITSVIDELKKQVI